MDLNELKNAWSEYDRKLTENLKLNKELFKKLYMDKSKNELYKPMYAEIVSMSLTILLFVFILFFSIHIIDEIRISVCGFILATAGLIDIILSGIKIKGFLKINYYFTPIIQLQQQIVSLKLLFLKLRKIELIVIPPLGGLTVFPVAYRWLYGIDIFNYDFFHLIGTIIMGIITAIVSVVIVICFYKYYYDKKIANAQHHLKEIEQFQVEE